MVACTPFTSSSMVLMVLFGAVAISPRVAPPLGPFATSLRARIFLQPSLRYNDACWNGRINATVGTSASGCSSSRRHWSSAAPYPNVVYPNATHVSTGAASYQTSPPEYPSPWGEGLGDWGEAYAKAQAFVSGLTLTEKVNLTTGTGWESQKCVGNVGSIPRLGFKALCMQDSPLGVRDTDFNSAFQYVLYHVKYHQ
jgi:hypothetical protein